MAAFDITAWLDGLGLGQYAPTFVDNAIAADVLPTLTSDDLAELGVKALGDRKRILAAIATLAAETVPPPAPGTEGERRQVTILFCDLVDFTGLNDRLGAEETHALLNRYFATVDGLVQSYGGTVDKHIGDNVMALFGAPQAHTDDPERACQLAIAIHAEMAALADETGLPIAVHIGIASGQVVASGTGSAAHREYTVTGPAVNLAGRLHEQAGAGETLIAEAVHLALSADLAREPIGEVTLRGIGAPQPLWRLTGRAAGSASTPATGLVGRVSESAQFAGIAKACRDTGTGRVVYLRGEAGIGKTRLLAQFLDLATSQGFSCHRALILDFGEGRGQDAIRTLVRSLLGVTDDTDETTRLNVAETAIAAGWADPDDRMFVISLLEVPLPDDLRAVYEAMDNAARTVRRREALAHLAAGIAAQTPIAIAVEDIHWAGAAELHALASVAAALASLPGLVILTSRADGDPLQRGWQDALQGLGIVTIDLPPLAPTEATELARQWVADEDAAFTRRAIERADGNPLFLEQLLRGGEHGDDDLPGTLRSVVLTRVDGLPAIDKQALQAACVMGQRFTLAALRFVLEQPNYDPAPLLNDNLIRAHGGDLLFAHALIRDGVYSSLLKARLRQLHVRAAKWFEGRDQVLQAEHLDRAGDPAAPGAYLTAARADAADYRFHRALELVERALPIAFEPEQIAVLTCFRGDLLRELGDLETSIATFRDAAGEAPDDACRLYAWIGLAEGLRIVDAQEEAIEVLTRAQPLAERSGRGDLLARIHTLRGNLCFPIGDFEGCRTEHEKALHYARATGSRAAEAQALGGLGDAAYFRAHMISAERHFSDCVRLAHDHGKVRIEAANLAMVGFTRFFQNRGEAAIEAATKAAELGKTIADLRSESLARNVLCAIYTELDRGDEAERSSRRSMELADTLGSPRFLSDNLSHLSMIQYNRGDIDLARETLEQALATSREFGTNYASAWILATAAVHQQDPAEKVRLLDQGEALLGRDSVSHNHLYFCQFAIEASLALGDWDRARRHAEALRAYTADEPFPWATFHIARAFALAEHGAGSRQPELMAELARLRDEAAVAGLDYARRGLTAALK